MEACRQPLDSTAFDAAQWNGRADGHLPFGGIFSCWKIKTDHDDESWGAAVNRTADAWRQVIRCRLRQTNGETPSTKA